MVAEKINLDMRIDNYFIGKSLLKRVLTLEDMGNGLKPV
jgi:hypothetical protein